MTWHKKERGEKGENGQALHGSKSRFSQQPGPIWVVSSNKSDL